MSLEQALRNGDNILLVGPGGVGKSHIIRETARRLTDRGLQVACTATTGIAAINLSVPEVKLAGMTLHSWAGVGLAQAHPAKLVAAVLHDGRSRKRWMTTDVLFVDEISMLGAELFDKLDYVARQVRRSPKPFGGLQLVLSGDFLQLSPVKDQWVFTSMAWKELEMVPVLLEEPKRYPDVLWFERLLRFRKAEHTVEDLKFLRSRVEAYESWKSTGSKQLDSVQPTILYSKRVDVGAHNDRELEVLPGASAQFLADDTFKAYNSQAKYEFYMRPLDETIPKCILLKVGAQVMLKANLDTKRGLANGSRGVVMKITTDGVYVKWVNDEVTMVEKHVWLQEDRDGMATRSQIPLVLAWALTIHKSQGATLDLAISQYRVRHLPPGSGICGPEQGTVGRGSDDFRTLPQVDHGGSSSTELYGPDRGVCEEVGRSRRL